MDLIASLREECHMRSLPFHEVRSACSHVRVKELATRDVTLVTSETRVTFPGAGGTPGRATTSCTCHLHGSCLACGKQSWVRWVKNAHGNKQSSLFKNKVHGFVGKVKFFGSTSQAVLKNMSEY